MYEGKINAERLSGILFFARDANNFKDILTETSGEPLDTNILSVALLQKIALTLLEIRDDIRQEKKEKRLKILSKKVKKMIKNK